MSIKNNPESLYGLSIDFVMRKNPMIKVTADGLIRKSLSEHDLMMLQSVEVPRHLPLLVEEIDENISLLYGYKGKKILALEAARERLELHQYIAILMEVSSILKRASDYMLNNGHYFLDPNWMMIGETWEDLFLLYLPLNSWPSQEGEAESVGDQLKRFALALMPHVNELEGTMFQQFVAALDQIPFSLDEVILTLQTTKSSQTSDLNFMDNPLDTTEMPSQKEPSEEETMEWEEEVYIPESAQPFPWQAALKGALAAVMLIGAYLIWKPYILEPQNEKLFLNSGLTMILLASGAVAMRWKSWRNETIPHAEETATMEDDMGTSADEHFPTPWRKIQKPSEEQPLIDSAITFPEQTVQLTQEDKTVLLQRPMDRLHEMDEVKPHLKLLRESQSLDDHERAEIRHIDQSPFVVGRDSKHAHWVVHEVGVSRTHFVIVTESKVSKFRDLGSSNGTRLNDEQIAPYKWYELNEQDQIQIGQIVFVYCKM